MSSNTRFKSPLKAVRLLILASVVTIGPACTTRTVGPWNLDTLSALPSWKISETAAKPGLKALRYEALPFKGQPVEVFAYYGVPDGPTPVGGWPAVVCVHGGGGTAFEEWVRLWNSHGYAAISMDLEGHYPIRETAGDRRSPRISTEHPGPERVGVFNDFEEPLAEQWYYHAVSQVILAHSLVRSFPEVNAEKIGITGISWGGTLTSTVMGVDDRFKFAIPVYGCGFLPDSDGHQGETIKPGQHTAVVLRHYDGSAYFENVRIPTFWVNGTNDKHFPMPSTQASARAVGGDALIRFELEMRHGHGPGWSPAEIYAFADSIVGGGSPLVRFGVPELEENQARVWFESSLGLSEGNLLYTRDTGVWLQRKWHQIEARVAGDVLSADLPNGASAFYFSATDNRGLMTSSEFVLVP